MPSPSSAGNASLGPPPETATWLKYVPATFGLRDAVAKSPYRWCTRESSMWGLATGTAMSLHRLRMGSRVGWAMNVGFGTTLLVSSVSYYFCVRARQHKEEVIELLMKAQQFEEARNMPPEPEDHPFLDSRTADEAGPREYRGMLPDRKDWQEPLGTQDAKDVFMPVRKN